jgi:hypothetical protein
LKIILGLGHHFAVSLILKRDAGSGAAMRRAWLALLSLSVTCGTAQAGQDCFKDPNWEQCIEREESAMLGKYFCVIDRVAGIQYEKSEATPYVGRIHVTDDKFFMQIEKDNSIPCDVLFGVGGLPPDCKSKYKMTIKSDLGLFGEGKAWSATTPYDFKISVGRGEIFIVSTGRFWANYRFNSSYVFEGKCEKLN